MLRVLLALTAVVAGLGTRVLAAGPTFEDIPVPGGTVALGRAAGLETPPGPSRFVAEIVRLTYGLPDRNKDHPSSSLNRLTAHLDVAGRFRAAIDALPNGAITLALASNDADTREHLKRVLDLIGLRLMENRGTYTVASANDKAAVARVQRLDALGVDVEHVEARLNAGETIHLTLPTELVPVPLTTKWWSERVFRRAVPAPDLFAAILANPYAAFLCRGLAGLDDETLEFVAESHELVERHLAGDMAPVFAAFAGSLRVHAGRVVTPGGDLAVPLWESVVGHKTTEPDAFIGALLSRDSGHLAYLYDLIAELDAPRAAFALGLWIQGDRARSDRFKALVSAVHAGLGEWQVRDVPFRRPLNDIAWMLLNMTVDATGAPRGPVARRLWSQVFETLEVPVDPADALRAVERIDREGSVDAAWLAETIVAGDSKLRGTRLRQLAFGLRVFSDVSDGFGDVLTALRALPSYPALMLTLERMAITDPSVYAAASRGALGLSDLDGTAAYIALNQFQGALALLSGMTAAGSLEPDRARALVASLVAVPMRDGRRSGMALAEWVRRELLPAIAMRDNADEAVLAALAGARTTISTGPVRVEWEGEQYRLDLPAVEERRLRMLRERQKAFSIGTALDLERIARELGDASLDLQGIQVALEALRGLLPTLAHAATGVEGATLPAGEEYLPDALSVVKRAVKDLSTITSQKDVRKAIRIAERLRELSGAVFGDAMSGVAYAIHLGDASGGARLEVDLSRRHDFGLGLKDKSARRSTPWLVPRQVVEPGVPRHVTGSLLGLDLAFAQLSLRRVVLATAVDKSPLLSNDRDTFIKSVALLNPHSMRDADRDAIATAVARGRARVAAAASVRTAPDAFEVLADEIALDGWRRRAARWEIAHDPSGLASFFSLNELLALGGGHSSQLNGWGMAATPLSGCLCTRVAAPNEWRIVSGRPQAGVMSSSVPDLNFQVAVMLSTLRLPASLAKFVLGAVVQDYIEQVRPNDPDDWPTLVGAASVVSRERMEDYVAAATADGPLVPESSYQEQPR